MTFTCFSRDELKQIVTRIWDSCWELKGSPLLSSTRTFIYQSIFILSLPMVLIRNKYVKNFPMCSHCLLVHYMYNDNHFHWSKAFPLYGRNYDSIVKTIETMGKKIFLTSFMQVTTIPFCCLDPIPSTNQVNGYFTSVLLIILSFLYAVWELKLDLLLNSVT